MVNADEPLVTRMPRPGQRVLSFSLLDEKADFSLKTPAGGEGPWLSRRGDPLSCATAVQAPGSPPGFWPAPGWDSQWDWKGYVPFEDLPHTFDPSEGFIVTANQAVTASPTPFLTSEWDYGFRAQRIRTLLSTSSKVSAELMTQVQGDTRNVFAPSLVERLLAVQVDESPVLCTSIDTSRPGWSGPAGVDGLSVVGHRLRVGADDRAVGMAPTPRAALLQPSPECALAVVVATDVGDARGSLDAVLPA